MQQQITPAWSTAFQAIASSVETGIAGSSAPQHRPLAAAAPMRTPVKLPGPLAQATKSKSAGESWQSSSRSLASFIMVRLWVWPSF